MDQRVAGFLINLRDAAKEAGQSIAINMTPISARQWMIPSFAPEIRGRLSRRCRAVWPCGGAKDRMEDRLAFVELAEPAARHSTPVIGIPVPAWHGAGTREGQDDLPPAKAEDAGPTSEFTRCWSISATETMESFNIRYVKATRGQRARTLLER